MRLSAVSNGTVPLAVAKNGGGGVALALIVSVSLGPSGEMHCPLVGSVWQRLMASGDVAAPVVAVAVIEALAPIKRVVRCGGNAPALPRADQSKPKRSSRGAMMSRHLMIPPSP